MIRYYLKESFIEFFKALWNFFKHFNCSAIFTDRNIYIFFQAIHFNHFIHFQRIKPMTLILLSPCSITSHWAVIITSAHLSLYLQYEGLLIDSQCIKQSKFILFTEVLHLHTAHVSHFEITAHNAVQQPLRWTAQHRGHQTL